MAFDGVLALGLERRSHDFWLAMWGVIAAIATGLFVAIVHPSFDAFLIALLACVLAAPILYRVYQKEFDPFEPLVFFCLAWAVMFVVRPLVIVLSGELTYTRPTRVIDITSTFTEMLLMAVIGAVAFITGYFLLNLRRTRTEPSKPPQAASFDENRLVLFATIAAGLGMAAFFIFLHHAGGIGVVLAGRSTELTAAISESSSYVYLASYFLIPAALTFLAIWRQNGNSMYLFIACALITVVVVRTLPIGSRIFFLPLVMGCVIPFLTQGGSRPRTVHILLLVPLALFASSLILANRNAFSRDDGSVLSSVNALINDPGSMLDPLFYGGDAAMAQTLSSALLVVPEDNQHTYGGAVFGDLIIRPFPRQLWPAKPETPRRELIKQLWPQEFGGIGLGGRANPEFSTLIFWYLDFSWPGIILGMMLFGLVFRSFYDVFRQREQWFWARVLFGLTLGSMAVFLRDSPVSALTRFIIVAAPFWLIFYLSRQDPAEGGTVYDR
jgi:oligosaccharide repeat unit polymerase